MTEAFTPARERDRHGALVARLRGCPLGRPGWVLCPRESVARALLDAVAHAGGGFVRVLGWAEMVEALELALALPPVPSPLETERVRSVERALVATSPVAASLGSDPFGVALGLLSVTDTLRMHGWDGVDPGPPGGDPADALLAQHVGALGAVLTAVESDLATSERMDLIGRMRRVRHGVTSSAAALPMTALTVEGVDRLAPLERELLAALTARGVTVDIAPWVVGRTSVDGAGDGAGDLLPGALAGATESPGTLLDALAHGVMARADDGSVMAVAARDPHDEAESVARWVAESVARGMSPEDIAVAVSNDPGAAQRVARALGRYGVAAHGGCASPTHCWPLWQVMRASVALRWRGVDVVDLATVLSAPGSGVWGADRDWLCAQLRRAVPTSWKGVREVIARATSDPAAVGEGAPVGDDDGVVKVDLDTEPAAVLVPDPVRAAQLVEIRARVEELVSLWEGTGPLVRLAASDRPAALRTVVEATLARFVNPMRFREGITDERIAGAWVAAAAAVSTACTAALERVESAGTVLQPHDPGTYLRLVEPLLGVVADAVSPRRGDGVVLLTDDGLPARRPRVLLVTGFRRGRYPSPIGRTLLLGPLERQRLGIHGGPLSELPGEAARGTDALRDTARMLALPTERLVLFWPRRTAEGGAVEPSLAWRDLLALLPPEARAARSRQGFTEASRWLATEHPEGARTPRARLLDALGALGSGRVAEAVALAQPLAVSRQEVRDLAMARFRPDRQFDVGDLVRGQVVTGVFTPRALETLLMCRYSFLTGQLLGLRPLRLARAPSLTVADRARVTRAALRSLDAVAAEGRTPTGADVKKSLDDAVTAHVPWADRGDMTFALVELRRTVQRFLARYMDLRRVWGLGTPVDGEGGAVTDSPPVALALPNGREIRVVAQAPRVETHMTADGKQALVMDLSLRSMEAFPKLRAAGLDLDAALVPALNAVRAGGDVSAFVRLSLSRPVGEALTRPASGAPFTTELATTVVTVDADHPLESHRERVLEDISSTLDELLAEGEPMVHGALYAPHDDARWEALQEAGAKSCDHCAMRLGCRFKMAGGQ